MIDTILVLIYLGGVVGTWWYFCDEAEPKLGGWESLGLGLIWPALAGVVLAIFVCRQGEKP